MYENVQPMVWRNYFKKKTVNAECNAPVLCFRLNRKKDVDCKQSQQKDTEYT